MTTETEKTEAVSAVASMLLQDTYTQKLTLNKALSSADPEYSSHVLEGTDVGVAVARVRALFNAGTVFTEIATDGDLNAATRRLNAQIYDRENYAHNMVMSGQLVDANTCIHLLQTMTRELRKLYQPVLNVGSLYLPDSSKDMSHFRDMDERFKAIETALHAVIEHDLNVEIIKGNLEQIITCGAVPKKATAATTIINKNTEVVQAGVSSGLPDLLDGL